MGVERVLAADRWRAAGGEGGEEFRDQRLVQLVAGGHDPLNSWITWEVIGVFIGSLASAFIGGRFRMALDGPPRLRSIGRIVLAFIGGAISGLGARISLGCTSGLGLSGAAVLATAGFVFLIGFFGSGVALGLILKRAWK